MASISIKKDFQDGEELFAEQLNLNFATIEAGVNTANKIVWQGENGEEVVAFRGTTEEINNRNIIDGQTLYNIETGETYLDVGSERISTGAGNVVAIGEEEPTNEATKIWINPDEIVKSEVGFPIKNEYGEHSDATYSCGYINNELSEIVDNINQKVDEIVKGTLYPKDGIEIAYSSYMLYGRILILCATLKATKNIAQYAEIASFSNGAKGFVSNGYLHPDNNYNCYINGDYGTLYIYQSGGLAVNDTLNFVGVYSLKA